MHRPFSSTAPSPTPRRWKGRTLCGIAAGHTGVALAVFHETCGRLLADGWVDSIGRDPQRGLAAWFLLFGAALCLFGMAVDRLESIQPGYRSPALGTALLLLIAGGASLMPASGFWLALPVALRLFR